MDVQLDQFKQFVRKYPGLRDEVRAKRTTWQNLYEEWYLYGEEDSQWEKYKTVAPSTDVKESTSTSEAKPATTTTDEKEEGASTASGGTEMLTQAFQYLQKMDMGKVQQTMGTVQQFVKLFQSFSGAGGAAGAAGSAATAASSASSVRDTYPGLFSKFDD